MRQRRDTRILSAWGSIYKIGVASKLIIDFASFWEFSSRFSSEEAFTVRRWSKGSEIINYLCQTTFFSGANVYPAHSAREKNGVQKQLQSSTLILLSPVATASLVIPRHGKIIGGGIPFSGRREWNLSRLLKM
jgi:hypothetical protein